MWIVVFFLILLLKYYQCIKKILWLKNIIIEELDRFIVRIRCSDLNQWIDSFNRLIHQKGQKLFLSYREYHEKYDKMEIHIKL